MNNKIITIILCLAGIAAGLTAGLYFGNRKTEPAVSQTPAAVGDQTATTSEFGKETETASEPRTVVAKTLPVSETPASDTKTTTKTTADNATADEDEPLTDGFERFTIAVGQNSVDTVADDLVEKGFIDDKTTFKNGIKSGILALVAGGYKLSKNMDESRVAAALQEKPYMKWVIVPEGLRKEEIAQILATELGWTAAQQKTWISTDTTAKAEYSEGVYFPDTYLIPVDEAPAKVAARMQAKFNEVFAAYLPEFNRQNIKWTTGLTFASIVQREAKNAADMPLIAGILWNRTEQGMALNADATLQYARGDAGNGWWAGATAADKAIDSPYNTYTNKGLPPHPICSPGINAIEATLNPAATDCLYYLHGNDGLTHCAATYAEHLQNIELYLKSGG